MAIKRAPSLAEQVKSHLKQRIVNAEFESYRIPSETELASQLNVSRNTIRNALSRLEMEGVIYRRQGAGTFITPSDLIVKTRLEEIVPYSDLITETGRTATVEVLLAEEHTADPEINLTLNRPPTEKMLEIKKLFRADGTPVIFSHTFIPMGIIKMPYNVTTFEQPTFQYLRQYCEEPLAYYLTDVVPIICPTWLATTLQLAQPLAALISFNETGYNEDNQPIVSATSYFRHDLLRLRMLRRVR
jgi:GntR family transcriptional regulator